MYVGEIDSGRFCIFSIHQIRNITTLISYKDVKVVMVELKRIYAPPTEESSSYEVNLENTLRFLNCGKIIG